MRSPRVTPARPTIALAADRAYADAMRALTDAYPDDLDARTLYAESLMDLRPWGYFTRDGQPHDETKRVRQRSSTCSPSTSCIPARCISGFTSGSRPIRSALKPKPIGSCR